MNEREAFEAMLDRSGAQYAIDVRVDRITLTVHPPELLEGDSPVLTGDRWCGAAFIFSVDDGSLIEIKFELERPAKA